jgi:regulator of sirC expression with transglutaminase-like and TPR domain
MQGEISDRFRALAEMPESQLGLAEGAFVLGAEARPDLDIEQGLGVIAELSERTRPLVDAANSPSSAVAALNHAFFELERFRGNQERYDDPGNSDLEIVLARRRGLPITLSILYVEVARRLGLEAYGVGFPGHFLAKVVGIADSSEHEIVVDPFFGRTLRREECAERLRAAIGDEGEELSGGPRRWLRAATALEIYVRMLNNLKLLYLRDGEGLAALGCFDRILVLQPDAAAEYRDRGYLLEQLDCVHAAIADYSRFVELADDPEQAVSIRRRRDALAQRKPALN